MIRPEIRTYNSDKKICELILSETIICVVTHPVIWFDIPGTSWQMVIRFEQDNERPHLKWNISIEELKILLSFNYWDSEDWLENKTMIKFHDTGTMKQYFMKLRTITRFKGNSRTIELSIWKEV